jgi:hypothetical protein
MASGIRRGNRQKVVRHNNHLGNPFLTASRVAMRQICLTSNKAMRFSALYRHL